MFLKRLFIQILLVFIQFSVIITGNDEIDKVPSTTFLTESSKEIIEITKGTQEALTYLKFVNEHWLEINFNDQKEIWRLHQQIVNFAKNIHQPPLTPEIIIQYRNTFFIFINKLRDYIKGVVYHHFHESYSQVQILGYQNQRINLEFQMIIRVAEQLLEKYDRIKKCWTELPEHVQNTIIQGHSQIRINIQNINPVSPVKLFTSVEILTNRQVLLQSISTVNDYVSKVLQNQETRRQQALFVPGPKQHQEVENQAYFRLGIQKRLHEQELAKQGETRKSVPRRP